MFKLDCKAQNYAWGKMGTDSLVGQIYAKHHPGQDVSTKPFAEYWMGGHPNGPSMVKFDKNDANLVQIVNDNEFFEKHDGKAIPLTQLFESNPVKYLGQPYLDRFTKQDPALGSQLTFLFKVLSVRTALSIQAHPNK